MMVVLERFSPSRPARPDTGPDENIDDDPSDSKVVEVGRVFCQLTVKDLWDTLADVGVSAVWRSSRLSNSLRDRWTSFRDWTTSPIVGLWLASGATQAAAMAAT